MSSLMRGFLVGALGLVLVACGSGDESADAPKGRTVQGAAMKGPLQGATVSFFLLDAAGNATGAALATTPAVITTDAAGGFTVGGIPADTPVLVKTSGGAYVDESDPAPAASRRRITLTASEKFEAVIPANAGTVAITPYSMALLKKARIQANGGNFANVFEAVRAQATTAFGFDPFTTIPTDPMSPAAGASAAAIDYAMLLGAAAQSINAIATTAGHLPGYADVMLFVEDLSDGQIDLLNFDEQVARFRNNNFGAYAGATPAVVDFTLLSQDATVPGNDPPVLDVNTGATVQEGGSVIFTTAELSASDADNTDAEIAFTVTSGPTVGTVLVNSLPATTFTQADIALGLVGYLHNGTDTTSDTFEFTVQDAALALEPNGPFAFSIAVLPVNDTPVMPFLTGSGELKVIDPSTGVVELVDTGVSFSEEGRHETIFSGVLSGTVVTDVHVARLVYVKGGKVWKVNLQGGASHLPVQVSGITNACRINGSAEDVANPDNTVLRVDTAGTDNACFTSDDFNTATAKLVRANAPTTETGVDAGVGYCCGSTGILDAGGNLAGFLTVEGDGTSNMRLRRRSATDLSVVAEITTFVSSGNGPTYSTLERGLGQEIWIRARRSTEGTFKLFRFRAADNSLTALHDYGVAESTTFDGHLDDAAYDATHFYFTDGAKVLRAPHAGTAAELLATATAGPVGHLAISTDHVVFEAHGASSGGVFSVPKAGGTVLTLASDNPATPTLAHLDAVADGLAYITIQSFAGGVFSTGARVARPDGSAGPADLPDASWAGQAVDRTCNLDNHCDSTFDTLAVFVRRNAATDTSAVIELVDPSTGVPSGVLLGTVAGVTPGKAIFGFGLGPYVEVTSLIERSSTASDTDIFIGNILDPGSIDAVSTVAGANDFWVSDVSDSVFAGGGSDTDGDGLSDETEASIGTNPSNADTDGDGLSDGEEVNVTGTDPLNPDTDGDGFPDGSDASPLTFDNVAPAFTSIPGGPYSVAITAPTAVGPFGAADANDPSGADLYEATFALSGVGPDGLEGALFVQNGLPNGINTSLGDLIQMNGTALVTVQAPLSRINATLQASGLQFKPSAMPFSGLQQLVVTLDDISHAPPTPVPPTATLVLAVNRIELSHITSPYITRFDGQTTGDATGWRRVGGDGGDFNGDGKRDLVIGAQQHPEGGGAATGPGKVYLVFGGQGSFNTPTNTGSDPFALSTAGSSNGFQILGAATGDSFGVTVTLGGDLDRDGFDDLVIGADRALVDPVGAAGRVYILFGGQTVPGGILDLASGVPAGVRMLVLTGEAGGDRFGRVEYAGDVDGDGYTDLLVGAPLADPLGRADAGAVYVVFGDQSDTLTPISCASPCVKDVASLSGSGSGFAVLGAAAGDNLGFTLAALQDFNGDGIDDFATAATGADPDAARTNAGQSYVIYGALQRAPSNIDLASLGTDGIVINGVTAGDETGAVAGVGDFDGDGLGDLLIGSQTADTPNGVDSGYVQVVYGLQGGYTSPVEIAALNSSTPRGGFVIHGVAAGEIIGGRIRGAGDVNRDGLDDFVFSGGPILPAPQDRGKATLILGSNARPTQPINLSALDGRFGLVVHSANANDAAGDGLGTAGDLNGDGFDDLVIAAPQHNVGAGQVYVVFGADLRRQYVDTDFDGLPDLVETNRTGTNPALFDTDGDGLGDGSEVKLDDSGRYDPGIDTSPVNKDTDSDTVNDAIEVAYGSDGASTVNTVFHVCSDATACGNDASNGLSWDFPLATNAGVVAAMNAQTPSGGASAAAAVFVLYSSAGTGSPGALNFDDPLDRRDRRYINFIGGIDPATGLETGQYTPFNGLGQTSAAAITQATSIKLRNIRLQNGNPPAGLGGGLLVTSPVHSVDNAVTVWLENSEISGNTAIRGGGFFIGGGSMLEMANVLVTQNDATSTAPGAASGGGGFVNSGGTLLMYWSDIHANSAKCTGGCIGQAGGAGLTVQGEASIHESKIRGNTTDTVSQVAYGGGIHVETGGALDLFSSVLTDNKASNSVTAASGFGGGIATTAAARVVVQHSLIAGNSADGAGGGFYAENPGSNTFLLFNNLVVGNLAADTASGKGGGLYLTGAANPSGPTTQIHSNTFAYNQAAPGAAQSPAATDGGGAYFNHSGNVDFIHNILWFNDNGTVGTFEAGDNLSVTGPGGLSYASNNIQGDGSPGGIGIDPMFVEGFYLTQASNPSVGIGPIVGGSGGSTIATSSSVGLADPFTTDPAGSGDIDRLDLGYHHQKGSAGAPVGMIYEPSMGLAFGTCERELVFRPVFEFAQSGEPGHAIWVVHSGDGANFRTLTTLDGGIPGARLALDRGDGTYHVVLTEPTVNPAGTANFAFYVDGASPPIDVAVSVACPPPQ